MHAHYNTARVHRVHRAATQRDYGHARIDGDDALDAGTDQGFLGAQRRHRLALHVGTHERAVGVIVFQERNQRGRYRHDLRRRHVDVVDLVHGGQGKLVLVAARHQLALQIALVIHFGVGLGDDELALFNSRQIIDLVGDLAVVHLAVRGFEKTVLVGTGIHRERVDQADVRTFRRFDRAYAAVMRGMHVAYFETGALACQAAWSEGRDAALVGDFR